MRNRVSRWNFQFWGAEGGQNMYCLQARLFFLGGKRFQCFFALVLLDMARGKLECWLQALSFWLPKLDTHTHTHTCSYVKNYTCILNIILCDVNLLPPLQLKVPKIFNTFWRGQLMRHLGLMTTGHSSSVVRSKKIRRICCIHLKTNEVVCTITKEVTSWKKRPF